jgi:hypothetical protein
VGKKEYSYQVRAKYPDGDPLTYELDVAPQGMVIKSTGMILWQPPTAGRFKVLLRVKDNRAAPRISALGGKHIGQSAPSGVWIYH